MRLYAAVALRSFRRYATYRVATAAGIFTNTVFGLVLAYAYIALWDQRPGLGGYTETQAVTYVWLGQSLLMTMALFGGGFADELAERIRTGDVAIDLYRPADLQLWWLASDLGRAGFHLLGRGVAPTALGALVFSLAWPSSAATWGYFLAALVLGMVVSFAMRYLTALVGFWLLDGSGIQQLFGLCTMFFSGMLLPLTVFPGWLGEAARALPWSAMVQVPVDVFLGERTGAGAVRALAFEAGWAAALLAAGRAVTALATRKVVVQGG